MLHLPDGALDPKDPRVSLAVSSGQKAVATSLARVMRLEKAWIVSLVDCQGEGLSHSLLEHEWSSSIISVDRLECSLILHYVYVLHM